MTTNSKKIWAAILVLAIVIVGILAASQLYMLRKAHSSFDNYYAFRGCVKLIDETPTYGDCQLASRQVIKLVNFRSRWYLDGDLPTCWSNLCL